MASMSKLKDPQAKLDYTIDWSKWLAGDTITGSTWTIAPTGALAIMTNPVPSFTATQATVWLENGLAGNSYSVTNHITTSAGRQDDRTITINVSER